MDKVGVREEVGKEKEEKVKWNWKQFMVTVIMFLGVLGGYHWYLVNYVVPRIKVFDLLGNLNAIQGLYVSGKMSEAEVQAVLNELRGFLERESNQRNVYILPAQVVLNKEKVGEIKFESAKLNEALRSSFSGSFFGNMTK
ncbi:MAG: hypothetical protein QW607_09885 [Desulfurococcaceae archaeon]